MAELCCGRARGLRHGEILQLQKALATPVVRSAKRDRAVRVKRWRGSDDHGSQRER